MTKVDMSLDNEALYTGCTVTSFDRGRKHLQTEPNIALPVILRNAGGIFQKLIDDGETTILLTGAMAIYVYTAVGILAASEPFCFKLIYTDARGEPIELNPHRSAIID